MQPEEDIVSDSFKDADTNYWLLAADLDEYGFSDLERDGNTVWNGVSEYVSQKNLRDVKQGDLVLVLRGGDDAALVGIGRVASDSYPDPGQSDRAIHAFDLEVVERLENEIPLSALLDDPDFQDWELIENPELEMAEIPAPLWEKLMAMSHEGLAQVARDKGY